MAHIALEGMAFYSYHGYYPHERARGNNFVVDVQIHYDMDAAADADDLEQSVNYEVVYNICKEEMDQARHLIETVAKSIGEHIRKAFPDVDQINVRLEKMKPDLGGHVAKAIVEYTC